MDGISVIIWVGLGFVFLVLLPIYFASAHGVRNFKVDYNKTLEELLKEAKFDKISEQINSDNFPMPEHKIGRTEILEGKLFFGSTEEEILKKMKPNAWRPAEFYENFAYCTKFKSKQEYNTIVLISKFEKLGEKFVIFDGSICKRFLCVENFYNSTDTYDTYFCALGVRPNP